MKRKILILGAAGMAGHIIKARLESEENFLVESLARSEEFLNVSHVLDIYNFQELEKLLKGKYDVVVNAVGLLNEYAELHPDKAILINSYLPHFLAQNGIINNYKLIHISTDCVFSGKKGNYRVTDLKDGEGFYATSKSLGEVFDPHLTIRTSIVGPELKSDGIGLFGWFMKQKGEVNGFTEAKWSGVTTYVLADAICKAIEMEITGLYQLTNNTKISKYELLRIFKDVFERNNVILHAVPGKSVDKSLINERQDLDFDVPDYLEMVIQMKMKMESGPYVYPLYYSDKA